MSKTISFNIKKYSPFANLADTRQISVFSQRACGNMSLFYADTRESLTNRKSFLEPLGIDYRDLVCAKQIHASSIRYAKEGERGKGALSYDTSIADTDAFVTDKINLPLAVFTADCLSIFLYDPLTPAIGLIHAGWRSSKENIIVKTIQLMQELFSTKPANLYAGFGPAIRSCCYEVGPDFKEFFSCGLIKKNNYYYLDLAQINKSQLLDSGIKQDNIFDSQICTSCSNEDFFSFRKLGTSCGRSMSVIILK